MAQVQPDNSFDELLSEVSRLHKYIGTPQLKQIGGYFDLSAGEMQLIYLHRLLRGDKLPLLAISPELLNEFESAEV